MDVKERRVPHQVWVDRKDGVLLLLRSQFQDQNGGPGQTRTADLTIISRAL